MAVERSDVKNGQQFYYGLYGALESIKSFIVHIAVGVLFPQIGVYGNHILC